MSANSQNRLKDIFFAHDGILSDKWEQYLAIYDAEFGYFVEAGGRVSVLEVGVQNGGSWQIWAKDFRAGSRITGIDVDKACGTLELGSNIEVRVGDASDRQQRDELLGGTTFDVVIDDGSHRSDHRGGTAWRVNHTF
ncbi:hypothetical protein [Paraburkholderia sp. A1RO-5L]|uniref:hypothetical protein n=1 Tax=unclassified Paraburkholderia TaxID=2615204 RepID=UPI003B82A8C0